MHLVQQNALRMYFFNKFLSQFLGFNGFFRAFREIFSSKMPHCTYFICPIYKIRIGVSSVIPSSSIHIYYRSISGSYQSVCFSPRRTEKGGECAGRIFPASVLCQFNSSFQGITKNMSISLCTLRIDKSIRNMYNKARNQRSTAEAQERANPADLKQKGAKTDG